MNIKKELEKGQQKLKEERKILDDFIEFQEKRQVKPIISVWIFVCAAICISWIWSWFKYSTADNNSLMWIAIFSIILAFVFGRMDGSESKKEELDAKYGHIMYENHNLEKENRMLRSVIENHTDK